MKTIKTVLLSAAIMFSSVLPEIALAHNSNSFATQMMHNILHAHHAFGGLLFIAVVVLGLKIKKKLAIKRIQTKR